MSAFTARRPRPMTTMTASPPDAPKISTASAASGKNVYDGHSDARSGRTGAMPSLTEAGVIAPSLGLPHRAGRTFDRLECRADASGRGVAVDVVHEHVRIVVFGEPLAIERRKRGEGGRGLEWDVAELGGL